MRVSPKSDYAIRALLDLCRRYQTGEPVSTTQIASRQLIPLKYLEQIMLVLKRAGIIQSKRGIGGGFLLNSKPQEITLGQVIRAVEGTIDPAAGLNINQENAEQQALQEVWVKVTASIANVIDHVTFADIMTRTDQLATNNDVIDFMI